MKTLFKTIFLLLISVSSYAQENTSEVYFLRNTKSMGSLTKFEIFVDGAPLCKINNKQYIISNLPVGSHEFSIQMTGKKAKSTAEKFALEIEEGKTYYFQVETPGSVLGSTSFVEITKNSADIILPKLKEIKCE
tara:strand:+ start:633 stop:1034 length:402 start_codon:yes stop_codon:yes gene_type:complete